MIDIWDANARALIAFALTIVASGVVYIAIRLSDLKRLDRRRKK